MPKRNLSKLSNVLKKNTPKLLMSLGVFFMAVSILHWYFRYQALSFGKELVSQYEQQALPNRSGSVPTHISIPWFVDTAIETQVYTDGTWTISETAAAHLAQSARPGENGNIIMYGHNKREILGNIRALKGTEIITITTQDGTSHTYQIVLLDEVDPNQTSYLEPTTEEILTIYTCSGFLDQKRFIVQAKPVKTT
jgi:LPXTG-site transpeptidase (sortase) family protein